MKTTRLTKILLWGLVVLCCFVCKTTAMASEENNSGDNVVKIVTVYVDESGNTYYVKQGTGFLIGVDNGDSAEKTIVTDYGIVEGDNSMLETIKKRNGLATDAKLELKYYAVGSMGVMTELSMVSYSNDTRYAILKTSMVVSGKDLYKLGDGSNVAAKSRIHIIGYPGTRSLLDQEQVSDRQMVEYDTIITEVYTESYYGEEITYFSVGENIEEGMAGAPIVDDEGCLIGMFILHNGEIKAISVESIRIVLDALGISYLENGDDETYDVPDDALKMELLDLVRENKDYISSIKRNNYTDNTWTALYEAIGKGEQVCQNAASTKKEYEDCIIGLKKARKDLKSKFQKFIVIVIIMAVVVTVLVYLLIKGVIKKRRLVEERKSI